MTDKKDKESPLTFVEPAPVTEPATQSPDDAAMEFSIFSNFMDVADTGQPVYNLRVDVESYTFYGKQLDAAQIEYVTAENNGIESDEKAVRQLTGKEQKKRADDMIRRSVAKDRYVVENSITSWAHKKHPMPEFTQENRDKVALKVWTDVADSVYAQSIAGRTGVNNAVNF